MTRIPLAEALAALERDLDRALSGRVAVRATQAELAVVATSDANGVRWELASPDDTAVHLIRLELRRRPQAPPRSRAQLRYEDETDEVLIGDEADGGAYPDIYGELPPIVRPKPGIEGDRP